MAHEWPLTLRAYRRLSAMLAPLTGLVIGMRAKRGKEDIACAGERRGFAGVERPDGPLIWIHGASVGEVLAAATLIERLRALNVRILLTSGTVTSAEIIAKRFPADVIHQYIPFDVPHFVARFLDFWQPSLALFIESDLWPNLILANAERRVPMVLINGRMSHRSFPRWQRAHATISALLGRFDLCLAQSEIDAERFVALGGRDVVATGNLKFDVQAPPVDQVKLQRLMTMTRGRIVIVAASTHPGEEEIIADAHQKLAREFPSLLTVIVPRHPQRGIAVARELYAAGLHVALRSQDELPSAQTDIYVADTLGELGLFYRLAQVVFMGGSLVEHGGQNPIEAIKLGAAVIHGPHVFNFTDVYAALDEADGARYVEDEDDLVAEIRALLRDPKSRKQIADAGHEVVEQLGGALDRTLSALQPYLMQLRIERGARENA
jgi:3-deoxy-D-manno-octulosonic-acid transferase